MISSKVTVKALTEGKVQEVIIASDADPKLTSKIVDKARELDVPVRHVDSMKKLGKACGIEVGASTVAIIC